jgi:hypothetical protein
MARSGQIFPLTTTPTDEPLPRPGLVGAEDGTKFDLCGCVGAVRLGVLLQSWSIAPASATRPLPGSPAGTGDRTVSVMRGDPSFFTAVLSLARLDFSTFLRASM